MKKLGKVTVILMAILALFSLAGVVRAQNNSRTVSSGLSCKEIIIPATNVPFIVKDQFVVNIGKDAPVKISYLGDEFQAWFRHKKEAPFGGSMLQYKEFFRLSKDTDEFIIAQLGGERKAETTLTELFALLYAQKNGEEGPLLTVGNNIFYIRDVDGVLRAVTVSWDSLSYYHVAYGWMMLAFDVADLLYVDVKTSVSRHGNRVFFRNS